MIEWKFDDEFGNSATPAEGTKVVGRPLNVSGNALAEKTDGVQSPAWKFKEVPEGTATGLTGTIPIALSQFMVEIAARRPLADSGASHQYLGGIPGHLFIRWTPANRIEAGIMIPGKGWQEVAATLDPTRFDNRWFSIALYYDGNEFGIVIDGKAEDRMRLGNITIPENSSFVLATCPWELRSEHFKGSIDHLKVFPTSPLRETGVGAKGKLQAVVNPFNKESEGGLFVTFDGKELSLRNKEMSLEFQTEKGLLLTRASLAAADRNLLVAPSSLFLIERTQETLKSDSLNITSIEPVGTDSTAGFKIGMQSQDGSIRADLLVNLGASGPAEWDLSVVNAGQESERFQVTFPILDGIKPTDRAEDTHMFYPTRAGLAGPGNYAIEHEYGIMCAFQLMSVFAKDASSQVYMIATDQDSNYKGLAIEKRDDQGLTRKMGFPPMVPASFSSRMFDATTGTSMAFCYPWLTVKAGAKYPLSGAKIGLGSGNWRPGFDEYKRWMETWLKKQKMTESLVNSFRFISQHPSTFYDEKKAEYSAFNRRNGPEHVFQWAFWEEYTPDPDRPFGQQMTKFQTGDYHVNKSRGGAPALKKEIETLKSAGYQVQLYLNTRLCSELSEFGSKHGREVAELGPDGRYNYPEKWYVSSAEELWQRHLLSITERIMREVKPDGIYLDEQPMLYPSYKTADGWELGLLVDPKRFVSLIGGMRDIIRKNDPKAHFMLEHFSDFFTQYSDCGWDQTTFIASRTTDSNDSGYKALYPGFAELDAYRLNFFRFLVPSFKLAEWGGDSHLQIARTVFNGIGACGSGAGDEPEFYYVSGQAMKELGGSFSSEKVFPLVDSLNKAVLVNRFEGPNSVVWTLWNTSNEVINEPVIETTMSDDERIVDTLNDKMIPIVKTSSGAYRIQPELPVMDVTILAKFRKTFSVSEEADQLVVTVDPTRLTPASKLEIYENDDRTGFRGAPPILGFASDELKQPVRIAKKPNVKTIFKLYDGDQLIDQVVYQ